LSQRKLGEEFNVGACPTYKLLVWSTAIVGLIPTTKRLNSITRVAIRGYFFANIASSPEKIAQAYSPIANIESKSDDFRLRNVLSLTNLKANRQQH